MSDLELIDCGDGRRLERFGAVTVDRPAPGATQPRRLPEADWARPALHFWPGLLGFAAAARRGGVPGVRRALEGIRPAGTMALLAAFALPGAQPP